MIRRTKKQLISVFIYFSLSAFASVIYADPFLSVRGQDQRCESLLEWLGIMEEISGGLDFQRWHNLNIIVGRVSPAFADDIFIPAIGKRYASLSKSEKKRIAKYLKICERKPYEFGFLSVPFEHKANPRYAKPWLQGIATAKNGQSVLQKKREEKAKQQAAALDRERVNAVRAATRKEVLPHFSGKVLLETAALRIHEFRFDTHDVKAMCANPGPMMVSVVIKDPGFRVTEQSVSAIFTDTLIPLQKSQCLQATQITARLFFEGIYLDASAADLSEQSIRQSAASPERWFADTVIGIGGQTNRPILQYFNSRPAFWDNEDYETLAGLRAAAARRFMTRRDWKNTQQRAANVLRVAGFTFKRSSERVLATGDSHIDFFTENPEKVGAALMGYSWAIVASCGGQVPGGTTSVVYSLSQDGVQKDSATFTIPVDFLSVFQRLGNNQTIRIDHMIASAKKQPAYTDVIGLIKAKGCSSAVVKAYHNNLNGVLNNVNADWNNVRGLMNLFRSIMMGG